MKHILVFFKFLGYSSFVFGVFLYHTSPLTHQVALKLARPYSLSLLRVILFDFTFFQGLSHSEKLRFARRITHFLKGHEIISRDKNLEITDEIRVRIAACAVQLTFGLPFVGFQNFSRILVYNNSYYSAIRKQYHQGEVNPAFGVMVLSYQNFQAGFAICDGRNLGLHEMAHAMQLDERKRSVDFDRASATWNALADAIFAGKRSAPQSLRSYAHSNPHEFFAVCVEVFFETPRLLMKEDKALYIALSRLLNLHWRSGKLERGSAGR